MSGIYIKKDEFDKLKEIGSGTDGRVFKFNKHYLIKIYRRQLKNIFETSYNIDDSDIKIYNKNNLKINNTHEQINYFKSDNIDNIRIRTKDALIEAIKRQDNIQRSNLPIDIVYIDGKFAGCLLKKVNGIQIHKLTGLPMKYKREIVKNILLDVKELLSNYIYHTDLSNSPFSLSTFKDEHDNIVLKNGHSHVLVNPFTLNTNIIDIDGKSTTYMERYNQKLEHSCLLNLTRLIIEFLFKINTDDFQEDEIYFELLKYELNQCLADKLANYKFEAIEEIQKELKL